MTAYGLDDNSIAGMGRDISGSFATKGSKDEPVGFIIYLSIYM
jgi:hypothetical protein